MTGGQAAVTASTAAVLVDGRREGSAVLVDARHLITAAHVLRRWDPETGTNVSVDQVTVEFPTVAGESAGRMEAFRVDLGADAVVVDVAVLDLGGDPPGWLPPPVSVWPAARMPDGVQVFGYPLAEGPLNGVWRRFTVAGPTTNGAMQLDWATEAGTFPGHSGGPVIDSSDHRLVGILVEGADKGRFDRFLPVTLIAGVWHQLRRGWLMTGGEHEDARNHFTRRAYGQRSRARGGDLFRGRKRALAAIDAWLCTERSPGRVLVVIGQPGAGKSAVLSRVALTLETEQPEPGLAFHARGAAVGQFLAAVADLVGIDRPRTSDQLVDALAGLPEQPPKRVLVDALDEAASDTDRREIAGALTELAVLPGLRVAVATRVLASGNRYIPGGLLATLGVSNHETPGLVDLDSSTYSDPDALRRFAAALLAQDGTDRPAPPDAAWESYRADRAACDRLATVIGERAGQNFLVAAIAAARLSEAQGILDPAVAGFDAAAIPSGVGEALTKHLERLPEQRQELERGLLTTLAYARGSGIDDHRWLAFASKLGYLATVGDLDTMRRSPATDYLLQAAADSTEHPVTRLFHQALTDELLTSGHQPSDEADLTAVILDEVHRVGWSADAYALDHAAEHAAAGHRLDELLDEMQYLLGVDPNRLVPHLAAAQATSGLITASTYRQVARLLTHADPAARASQLELAAYRRGYADLAERIARTAPDRPWRTGWSHGRPVADHQALSADSSVLAVAVGVLPDSTPVVVGGCADKTVRVWRLSDGASVGPPLTGHDGMVGEVATTKLEDGTPVIVSGSDDDTLRIWRIADGAQLGPPLTGHKGVVTAVTTTELEDGTRVIVSGGFDGTVRVWRLADGAPLFKTRGHQYAVRAIGVGRLPNGDSVIVSGCDDNKVRLWRLADCAPLGKPRPSPHIPVATVSTGLLPDGTPVFVTGGGGAAGLVQVWRLAGGTPLGEPFTGDESFVDAVAVGETAHGNRMIVSAGLDKSVRLWRLPDGAPLGELRGHEDSVSSVAVVDGGSAIVSGGFDDTVRVWSLEGRTPPGQPLIGHDETVRAVATTELLDGTSVIVSASEDGTVRVWRFNDGAPVGRPLAGHLGPVQALTVGALSDGTPVVVSGGFDQTVRAWRLQDGAPVGQPLADFGSTVLAVAMGRLSDGTPVVVSGGFDETVRLWRLEDGAPIGSPVSTTHESVFALTVTQLTDGTPVIVSGGFGVDRSVRVWRLADGAPLGEPLTGHEDAVRALAGGALLDGTRVIVSGSDDGTVRVWRLADGAPLGEPINGHEGRGVLAVATSELLDGTPVIISGGNDGTVRVWSLDDGSPRLPPLRLPTPATAIASVGETIVAAFHADVAVFNPTLTAPPAPNVLVTPGAAI